MIKIKRLSDCSFQEAVTAWNLGFTGYLTDVQMTLEVFLNRLVTEGLSTELSIIAFDDHKPIGLVLNGIRELDGKKIAWNGGTGVAPEYRHKGLGKRMMEQTLGIYQKQGVDIATLEAIKENEKAIELYKKMGYIIEDQLLIYANNQSFYSNPFKNDFSNYEILKVKPSKIQHIPFYKKGLPWQTQWQSVKSGEGVLVLDKTGICIGYALYKQNENDEGAHVSTMLYQCEILEGRNDELDIAVFLLSHCFSPFDQESKRMVLNLSHKNQVVIKLLYEMGFEKKIEQVYMEKTLKK
ncbi:GNAT family N-acetyltransferase [Chengkuizengella axinellae]|uniref:N-acetyltransferase n=1 Tax=Chengkuizengella axinellae TaxID=3064388 RepID=A0ABT9IXG3_9BACL|nr:N-acetyltransferase [Chengkuizengella sp. 2205SS18-9]MDP5273928.1 N-acetyltransferase [Chengkuizengella sp. 2205SS18-9]